MKSSDDVMGNKTNWICGLAGIGFCMFVMWVRRISYRLGCTFSWETGDSAEDSQKIKTAVTFKLKESINLRFIKKKT